MTTPKSEMVSEYCFVCGKIKPKGGELWFPNTADACKNPCDCKPVEAKEKGE